MNDSKNSFGVVVAVVIAIVALGFSAFGGRASAPADNLQGERAGLQEFIDGIKAGDANAKWVSKTLPAGSNSVLLYKNNTGRDVIVDYGEANVITGETASSTTNISIFATTSASVSSVNDFTALTGNGGKASLIDQITLATSTTATTTSSVYAARANKGNGAIVVPDGSSVFGYLQQNTTLANVACSGAGLCETATSSNRGFNPVFNIRVHKTGPSPESTSF